MGTLEPRQPEPPVWTVLLTLSAVVLGLMIGVGIMKFRQMNLSDKVQLQSQPQHQSRLVEIKDEGDQLRTEKAHCQSGCSVLGGKESQEDGSHSPSN